MLHAIFRGVNLTELEAKQSDIYNLLGEKLIHSVPESKYHHHESSCYNFYVHRSYLHLSECYWLYELWYEEGCINNKKRLDTLSSLDTQKLS